MSDLSSFTSGALTASPSASSIQGFTQGSSGSSESTPCDTPCGKPPPKLYADIPCGNPLTLTYTEVAAYHAMGIGRTPELCDEDETPFMSAYENCAACIDVLGQPPDDVLKSEVQQALEYCNIEVSTTVEISATEVSARATSEESAATSSSPSSPPPTQTSDESDAESTGDSGDGRS